MNIKKIVARVVLSPFTMVLTILTYLFAPLLSFFEKMILNGSNSGSLFLTLSQRSVLYIFLMAVVVEFTLVFLLIGKKRKLGKTHVYTLILLTVICILYNVVVSVLKNIELVNFPNYLFSTYGLNLSNLIPVSNVNYLLISLFAASVFKSGELLSLNEKLLEAGSRTTIKFGRLIIYTRLSKTDPLFFLLGVVAIILISLYPFTNHRSLITNAEQGYKNKIGKNYVYFEFLNNYTNMDDVVIHPPQSGSWPDIGNQPILRYFLFPRTLVSGELVDSVEFAQIFQGAKFVVIHDPKWPDIDAVEGEISFNGRDYLEYERLVIEREQGGIVLYSIYF